MLDNSLFSKFTSALWLFDIMQKGDQWISWKWIERLYLMETTSSSPGVRLCHKLSRDHVWLNSYTRMRVNLAAQVSSTTIYSVHAGQLDSFIIYIHVHIHVCR